MQIYRYLSFFFINISNMYLYNVLYDITYSYRQYNLYMHICVGFFFNRYYIFKNFVKEKIICYFKASIKNNSYGT